MLYPTELRTGAKNIAIALYILNRLAERSANTDLIHAASPDNCSQGRCQLLKFARIFISKSSQNAGCIARCPGVPGFASHCCQARHEVWTKAAASVCVSSAAIRAARTSAGAGFRGWFDAIAAPRAAAWGHRGSRLWFVLSAGLCRRGQLMRFPLCNCVISRNCHSAGVKITVGMVMTPVFFPGCP